MAKIAIVYRPQTPKALQLAKEVTKWLKAREEEVYTFPEQKVIPGTKRLTNAQAINRLSLVLVLGGDGTYLNAVRMLKGRRTPILGVNMGSLGFLTETRLPDLYKALDLALQEKMDMRPRSMLNIRIMRGRKVRKEYLALNDLVVERGAMSQLINMSIYSERFFVSSVKADGLIVAGPTGSTAYNLAAGGPILHPEVKALVCTPVAAHSLTSRPMIFPDDKTLSLQVTGVEGKAFLSVDGQKVGEITEKDRVDIQRSEHDHMILRMPGHSYFELLREKLKFGQRD